LPPNPILTPRQRETFDSTGLLCFEGLLSAEAVRQARRAVLQPLERLGLWREGAWRLDSTPRPRWPDTGLKTSKAIGNRRPELEALLDEPALAATADALLDGRAFDRTLYKRPQLLLTLPNADVWTLPTGWHVDCPRLASGERPGVQVFAFLEAVGPHGGGTVAVAGSHRLLNHGRFIRVSDMRERLGRDAFFRRLYGQAPGGGEDRSDLPGGVVGDVPLQVVELTGEPGDAWFMDLRVLHAGAPNAAEHPRLMITHRFLRADLVAEVAEGLGWASAAR
jgi:hypothetical protein